MMWASWGDFFAMGGYAFYVWGSLAMVAGCLLCEVVWLRLRRQSIHRQLKHARLADLPRRRVQP